MEIFFGILMGIGLIIQYFVIEYQDQIIKEFKAHIKRLKDEISN